MNDLKRLVGGFLIFILISLGFFIYGCYGGRYREDVLNELEGQIIYIRRDTESVLKIYTSKANLEDEILLYEHHDSIENGNIIALDYDQEQGYLVFEAYDDTLGDWGLFTLDADLKVTSLGVSSMKGTWKSDEKSTTSSSGTELVSQHGDLYLSDLTAHKLTLLKNFTGILDGKFSPGYIPLTLSPDGKFAFYAYSKHATPIGLLFETLMNPHYQFQTYVMEIESGRISLYVNFEDIIFMDETKKD